jgi:Xaa-Pro aminopeptidase
MSVPAGQRTDRLRAAMAQRGLDALLVTSPVSVRYLSTYAGSNGLLCVTPGGGALLTDFRYATAVAHLREQWNVQVVDSNLVASLAERFADLFRAGGRVGFESAHLSHHGFEQLQTAAGAAGVELVPTLGLVEGLRAVKSADELDCIARGAAMTDQVYEWLADEGLAGRNERELAWEVAMRFRELGAEGPSFVPIVASGEHGALPHGRPRDVEIERGTLVVIDIGALVDGYCSDCTRTFTSGPVDGEMREVYELVLRAQEAALALVRPGTPCAEVHEAARRMIAEAGYGEHFRHGTGHGVGLAVHEEPRLRAGAEGVLEPGNVVTVEPGVYLPGRFGVRIEDLVVVTEGGHDVLSKFPKSLVDAG